MRTEKERESKLKELVYASGDDRSAADYMDHCARTTEPAYVEIKEDRNREKEG